MPRALLRCLIAVMISVWLVPMANAATIVLLSGETIKGKITERTELRLMVNVKGTPRTFYLGEIATINGHPVYVYPPKPLQNPPPSQNAPNDQQNNDEKDSLINFMNKRSLNTSSPGPAVEQKAPVPSASEKTGGAGNKNVVSTPDGGIIVVGPDKIVKYDRNLNVVKQVDLNADNTPVKATPPPVTVAPPPTPAQAPVKAGNKGLVNF